MASTIWLPFHAMVVLLVVAQYMSIIMVGITDARFLYMDPDDQDDDRNVERATHICTDGEVCGYNKVAPESGRPMYFISSWCDCDTTHLCVFRRRDNVLNLHEFTCRLNSLVQMSDIVAKKGQMNE